MKPLALIKYLIKLITPPNGIVLDMFAGSGTTGVAAKDLGLNYILIDIEQKYCEIAEQRIRLRRSSFLLRDMMEKDFMIIRQT